MYVGRCIYVAGESMYFYDNLMECIYQIEVEKYVELCRMRK